MKLYKKYVVVFFLAAGIAFLCIELSYQLHGLPTDRTQMRLKAIENQSGKFFEHAIFGSSVTFGALGKSHEVYPNVFNGSTVSSMTIAGQYFMLKELSEKNMVNKAYISFAPTMLNQTYLHGDVSEVTKRYFYDVFFYKYKDEILDVAPDYKHQYEYFVIRKFYFKSLIEKFIYGQNKYSVRDKIHHKNKKLFDMYIKRKLKKVKKCKRTSLNTKNEINKMIYAMDRFKISNDNRIFIKKIVDYGIENGIEIYFVLEPLPLSIYEKYKGTKAYQDLMKIMAKLNYFDGNTLFLFKDCYHRDAYHLKNDYTFYYEKIIFNDLLKLGK